MRRTSSGRAFGVLATAAMAVVTIGAGEAYAQQADIGVDIFSNTGPTVYVGKTNTITMIVDNFGPNQSVQPEMIVDAIIEGQPSGQQAFLKANGCSIAVRTDGGLVDEFDCFFGPGTGIFTLGTFGANWLNPRSALDDGRMIVTINFEALDPGQVTFRASIGADTADPNASNNTAFVTINAIPAEADTTVAMSSVVTSENKSTTVDYTIVVENLGPCDAVDTSLVVALPSVKKGGTETVEVLSMSLGCVYDAATHSVTCDLGTLDSPENSQNGGTIDGAEVEISIRFQGKPGELTATATVDSSTADPDTTNNVDTDVIAAEGNGKGSGQGKGSKKP